MLSVQRGLETHSGEEKLSRRTSVDQPGQTTGVRKRNLKFFPTRQKALKTVSTCRRPVLLETENQNAQLYHLNTV